MSADLDPRVGRTAQLVFSALTGALVGTLSEVMWYAAVQSTNSCVSSPDSLGSCLPVPIVLSRIGVLLVATLTAWITFAVAKLQPLGTLVFWVSAATIAILILVPYAIPVPTPRSLTTSYGQPPEWLLPLLFTGLFALVEIVRRMPKVSHRFATVSLVVALGLGTAGLVRDPLENALHRREIQRTGLTLYLPSIPGYRLANVAIAHPDPRLSFSPHDPWPRATVHLVATMAPKHPSIGPDGEPDYTKDVEVSVFRDPCGTGCIEPVTSAPCTSLSPGLSVCTDMVIRLMGDEEVTVHTKDGLTQDQLRHAATTLHAPPVSTYLSKIPRRLG